MNLLLFIYDSDLQLQAINKYHLGDFKFKAFALFTMYPTLNLSIDAYGFYDPT